MVWQMCTGIVASALSRFDNLRPFMGHIKSEIYDTLIDCTEELKRIIRAEINGVN